MWQMKIPTTWFREFRHGSIYVDPLGNAPNANSIPAPSLPAGVTLELVWAALRRWYAAAARRALPAPYLLRRGWGDVWLPAWANVLDWLEELRDGMAAALGEGEGPWRLFVLRGSSAA